MTTTVVIKGGGLKMWVSGTVSGENNFYPVPKDVTLISTQIQILFLALHTSQEAESIILTSHASILVEIPQLV